MAPILKGQRERLGGGRRFRPRYYHCNNNCGSAAHYYRTSQVPSCEISHTAIRCLTHGRARGWEIWQPSRGPKPDKRPFRHLARRCENSLSLQTIGSPHGRRNSRPAASSNFQMCEATTATKKEGKKCMRRSELTFRLRSYCLRSHVLSRATATSAILCGLLNKQDQ